MLLSCSQKVENPFLSEYDTPFEVPPFDKIENVHYLPAYNKGIELHNEEIERIVTNTEVATFENTILELEYSGSLIQNVFGNLLSADTNDEMQAIAKEIYPKLSKHQDEILLNEKLFEKVKSVYDKKDQLNLDKEELKLLEETYKDFVRSGANLSNEKKSELRL